MEGEGSPSNHEDQPAPLDAAEVAAAYSSSSSSSEFGKISSFDGFVSSRENGSSSSNSNRDESSDSDSGGDVEIMLSDTNAKKPDAGIEEGEIAEGSSVAAVEESGETWLAKVPALKIWLNPAPASLVEESGEAVGFGRSSFGGLFYP
jgi:hypothetical protein